MDSKRRKEPQQHSVSSLKKAPVSSCTTSLPSCALRSTQDKIEALKRSVFNLKLERFLLQEELKTATGISFRDDSKSLLRSVKYQQFKYDSISRELENKTRLLEKKSRELEDRSESLTNALALIEYHKELGHQLKENQKAESKKLQATVQLLKDELKRKNDHLKLFRLRKQKKLINYEKERKDDVALYKSAKIVALPGKNMTTRFSAYRRKFFRVKLVSMAEASSPCFNPLDLNEVVKHRQIETGKNDAVTMPSSDNKISNKLLLEILKWIVMRHNIKHENNFHLDVIFMKDTLRKMALFQATDGNVEKETPNSENNDTSPSTSTVASENELHKNNAYESSELKLSPFHLMKLIFMPFGFVNPFHQ